MDRFGGNPRRVQAPAAQGLLRPPSDDSEIRGAVDFCQANKIQKLFVTTRTVHESRDINGVNVQFVPASVYCHAIGWAASQLTGMERVFSELFPPRVERRPDIGDDPSR